MNGLSASAKHVTAVVVTHNPPAGFAARLETVLQQVGRVIVCDNGSAHTPELPQSHASNIHLLDMGENRGIAAALNAGIAQAHAQGATHALLLDHDSTPAAGMVEALLNSGKSVANVAIRVPRIRYGHPQIRCRWPQAYGRWRFRFAYADNMSTAQPVDLAIGSGMLLDLSIWHRHGGFDETLFIDLVDTEYCLYLRRLGYAVVAVPQAELQHSLGEVQQRRLLGIKTYPTHHSAARHYTINRNRIVLSYRYGWRYPNWLAYEWLGAVKLAVKALCFEPGRLRKLGQMVRGTFHGLQRCRASALRNSV